MLFCRYARSTLNVAPSAFAAPMEKMPPGAKVEIFSDCHLPPNGIPRLFCENCDVFQRSPAKMPRGPRGNFAEKYQVRPLVRQTGVRFGPQGGGFETPSGCPSKSLLNNSPFIETQKQKCSKFENSPRGPESPVQSRMAGPNPRFSPLTAVPNGEKILPGPPQK